MFKRSCFILIIAFLFTLTVGCSTLGVGGNTLRGSGKPATRDYQLDGFTGISSCCGFKITVTGGSTYKVSVTADDNLLDVLSVRKEGDVLHVEIDTSKAPSINSNVLQAGVTMPNLQAIALNGGAQLNVAEPAPSADALTVTADGGSRITIPQIQAQNANVTLNGGSQATIKVTGTLSYDVNGGSQLWYTGQPAIGKGTANGGAFAKPY